MPSSSSPSSLSLSPSVRCSCLAVLSAALAAARSHWPLQLGTNAHSAYLLASTLIATYALQQTLHLRRERHAARARAQAAAVERSILKPRLDVEAAAAALPLAPAADAGTDTFPVELGLLVLAVPLLSLVLLDLFFIARSFYRGFSPTCYVIDHGVRSAESCEAFFARVGRDNPSPVSVSGD